MHLIDWVFLVVYLGCLTGIGIYFSRRQSSIGEFLKGGKRINWLAVGLSLMAALNSGMDYIQTPAIVFVFGMVYLSMLLTWIPLYPWVMRVTVPFYRRLEVISAYEYLERRFNLGVRMIASSIFVLWRISWMGVALYIPCLAVQGATEHQLGITWMAIILGLIVTLYTMLGGIQAVIWTDVLQSIVMFSGLAATLAIIVTQVPGGLEAVWSHAVESGKLTMATPIPNWSELSVMGKLSSYMTTEVTFWGTLLCILVGRMAMYTGDQVAVQRFQTIRSYRDARNAFIVSGIADIIWMSVLGFVGLALFAYTQHHPLPQGLKNDTILPYFMSQHFTVGLTGLVVASILAASLSSVDAALNSTTSIIVVDFYIRWWLGDRTPASEGTRQEQRHMVWISRCVTAVLGILAVFVAASVEQLGEVYTIGNKLFGAFFGILFGIFALGMFSRKASSQGVLCGAVIGLATSCFFSFFSELTFLHEPVRAWLGTDFLSFCAKISWQWPPLFGIGMTLLVGRLASMLMPHSQTTSPLTYWEVMQLPDPVGGGLTDATAASK